MSQAPKTRTATVFLVDDNPADIRLAIEALKDIQVFTRLEVAHDGDEAVSLLRESLAGLGVPVPDLILLDLNLPKKDGREVLAEIKADPSLRRIPVVVLTTSRAEDDVLRCYDLHANCYVIKPIGFEEYVDVVRSIEAFWLSTVLLPAQR